MAASRFTFRIEMLWSPAERARPVAPLSRWSNPWANPLPIRQLGRYSVSGNDNDTAFDLSTVGNTRGAGNVDAALQRPQKLHRIKPIERNFFSAYFYPHGDARRASLPQWM